MTTNIVHPFVSTAPQGADAAKVRTSDWNVGHTATYQRTNAGSVSRTIDSILTERHYSVKDFGAVGNNVADDGPAIQACIDAAYAASINVVYIPATDNGYKVTAPIYLDPPANLRVSLSAPTIFAFQMTLLGDPGDPNIETFGTTLRPTAQLDWPGSTAANTESNFVCVWVGTGQGMRVENITIRGVGNYHANADIGPDPDVPTGGREATGFAIATGNGGSTRAHLINCGVYNMRRAFSVGQNGPNALGDSNLFERCWAKDCYTGFEFKQGQNFINNITNANVEYCSNGVIAEAGQNVWIRGGNWSAPSMRAAVIPMDSISALAGTNTGNVTTYSFTAHLTVGVGSQATNSMPYVYDAFAIKTTHYGLIPLQKTGWTGSVLPVGAADPGTAIVTLIIDDGWMLHNFGKSSTAATTTDLEADIQACTQLFCCETAFTFRGSGINVQDMHIENQIAYTCLFKTFTGIANYKSGSCRNLMFNYNSAGGGLCLHYGLGDTSEAQFICQQVHPLFDFVSIDGTFEVANVTDVISTQGDHGLYAYDGAQIPQVSWDKYDPNTGNIRCSAGFKGGVGIINANNYLLDGNANQRLGCGTYGCGEFDRVIPFPPTGSIATNSVGLRTVGTMNAPARGYVYKPGVLPVIPREQWDIVSGSLAAKNAGEYATIFGQQIYQVQGISEAIGSPMFVKSRHRGWSYGKDLVVNWACRGQANVVYIARTDMDYFFHGLTIGLDIAGTITYFVIAGIYPTAGYIQVHRYGTGASTIVTTGVKTTDYTGATIYQEPFVWETMRGTEQITLVCSDETTPLTTGAAKITYRMPYAMTLTAVRASLSTAQATNGAGTIFTVDVNGTVAGVPTSLLSAAKLTIDNTERTSTTAATAVSIVDTSLADDEEVTVDIDNIGDGTAKGLKVMLVGYRAI